MKHMATLAAIDAAELRMEVSRREVHEGLRRVKLALRETATRPSTLAAAGGIAGLAGLAGLLLVRRRPRRRPTRATYARAGTGVVVASSLAAIARLVLSRYGVRGLTLVVRQLRKRWEAKRAATPGAGSEYPVPASD